MTPTEQDKELRDILSKVLVDGQNQIHDLKDGKATPEQITERMFASLDYWQPKLMQLITADRKRVALEARENISKLYESELDMHRKFMDSIIANNQLKTTAMCCIKCGTELFKYKGGKPMTNYNERLDELLANLVNQVAANEQRLLNGNATREETIDSDSNATMRAEKAITSLMKELVAEAKPERRDEPSPASGYYAGGDGPVKNSYQIFSEGHNRAIDQFEQNLLKALEEL